MVVSSDRPEKFVVHLFYKVIEYSLILSETMLKNPARMFKLLGSLQETHFYMHSYADCIYFTFLSNKDTFETLHYLISVVIGNVDFQTTIGTVCRRSVVHVGINTQSTEDHHMLTKCIKAYSFIAIINKIGLI